MEDNDSAGWSNLTLEALVEVFRRLDFEDRYVVIPLVCKAWLGAVMEPACWERADMEECFSTRQENSEWWSVGFERKMDVMIRAVVDRSLGRLLELRTRHCSDEAVSYAAFRCPMLQCLSVKDSSGVTDRALCRIALTCLSLNYVDVSECRHISALSLKNLAQNCKSMSVLKRNLRPLDDDDGDWRRRSIVPRSYLQVGPSSSGDEEAIVLGTSMPNLTHLELRHSTISDIGLSCIVKGCTKLSHLDLYGCTHVSQRALHLASECLRYLKKFVRPTSRIITSSRYSHWQLYDERFQNRSFQF
ncbi:hypothetical protein O6H91_04G069400 [Diphasiastrum complanatum]|uniref:Uncharacterized protein n=1 Tax=Diphasiastrum complanatum TaxID=34168 RepID=A0ACC2DXW0_DIPCM|nr:hypothetical protein O6H91_04G069400 [Diphasiastrum complanatum]